MLSGGVGISIIQNFNPGVFTISAGSITFVSLQSSYGKSVFLANGQLATLPVSVLQPSLPTVASVGATAPGVIVASSLQSAPAGGASFALPGVREQSTSFNAETGAPGFGGAVLGGARGSMSYQDPNR